MEFTLNLFNRLFDLISFGTSTSARYWFIAAISLLSAFVFLYLFKLVSNQQRIKKYKNRIWGNLLQMRIYQDNLRVICTSILKVIWYNLLYLKEMLVPLLVLLPALAVFTMQVNNRCGYAPLAAGERVAIRVVAASGSAGSDFESLQGIELETAGGIMLQTPALRAPDEGAVYWRAGVEGDTQESALIVSLDNLPQRIRKQVAVVGAEPARFGPVLCKWSWQDGLLHNAEGFLPADSRIESIRIDYQRRQYPLLWWDTDSLVVYFVLVLVLALAFKPLFRVTL